MKVDRGIPIIGVLLLLSLSLSAAEGSGGRSRFSLNIAGGIGNLALGDFNAAQRGQNEALKDSAQRNGYGLSGEYQLIHFGLDLEVEACLSLAPRLAVILGSGYARAGTRPETSQVTIEWNPTYTSVRSLDAKMGVVPIFLGLKYDISAAGKVGFFIKGSFGYYFARFSELHREDLEGDDLDWYWYTFKSDSRGGGFGFQGGLGFEYRANRHLAFILEGCGRYARIRGFEADYRDEYSYGLSRSGSGTLYYYEYNELVTEKWYPNITIWTAPLSDDPTVRNVREAAIDFSGFALRAGFKIYL